MAAVAPTIEGSSEGAGRTPLVLGGYAAMAESAWMGSVQATEVLEPVRALPAGFPRPAVRPRLPRNRLAGLYARQFTISEASVILMASFFSSALLGAVRQVLFNAQFGTGMEANAYYAAFRLPDTLFSLIAGGALSSAMIPVLLTAEQEGGRAAGRRYLHLVLTSLLAVFAAVVLLGELFAPAFVGRLLAPGFDAQSSQLTTQLTRIMLVQPLILAAGSVATAVLNSRNQFFPTALSVLGHNIALIAGILAARFIPSLGIYGPTLGVVGGAVLQVIFLFPGLAAESGRFRPKLDLADARLRETGRLLVPNGLSVSVNYAGFILDTSFASQALEGAGLAAIYNAWLLVGLPIALLGQAIGQAVFPRLAESAASANWPKMRRDLFQSLVAAIGLALPALLGLLLLGRQVIRLLFERGKFDAAAGDLTYQVLLIYSLALPAYVATELVTRGLVALKDTRTPLATNSLQLLGRGLLMAWLVGPYGVQAIPAAFAITATIEAILLSLALFLKLRRRIAGTAQPAAA